MFTNTMLICFIVLEFAANFSATKLNQISYSEWGMQLACCSLVNPLEPWFSVVNGVQIGQQRALAWL